MAKCLDCGKRCTKYNNYCNTCLDSREKIRNDKESKIVESGKCPVCGNGIRRNLALCGWYQCDQYGTEGFRKDPTKSPCTWQTFAY